MSGPDDDEPKTVSVGYNRVSTARRGDKLATAGLANCIAIAVQDPTTGIAAMGHFHTGLVSMATDDAYIAFRALLITALNKAVGADVAHPTFHVSLGTLAASVAGLRATIVGICQRVFGVTPTSSGAVAWFDTTASRFYGSTTNPHDVADPIDGSWANDGDEIPYTRLEKPNTRGWKLDRHLGLLDKASLKFT